MGWRRVDIEVSKAGSLLWVDGGLYDVADGWRRLDDGSHQRVCAKFGDFDSAMLAPGRDVAALVDSDGTKALLLGNDGFVVRELNRSWYCATNYRYPLALFTLPDGRTAVAHCPDHYNRIEIEVATTGERLTDPRDGKAVDTFHSRLQVSDDGTRLLSAGWVWHPLGVAGVFSLGRALEDASILDKGLRSEPDAPFAPWVTPEVGGACFVGADVVVATSEEGAGDGVALGPFTLARWSTAEGRYLWQRPTPGDLGDLVGFHGDVLALNQHPRLFDSQTGDLLAEWPDVAIPPTVGSLFLGEEARAGASMIAVDPDSPRFAVAQPHRVTVISQTVD